MLGYEPVAGALRVGPEEEVNPSSTPPTPQGQAMASDAADGVPTERLPPLQPGGSADAHVTPGDNGRGDDASGADEAGRKSGWSSPDASDGASGDTGVRENKGSGGASEDSGGTGAGGRSTTNSATSPMPSPKRTSSWRAPRTNMNVGAAVGSSFAQVNAAVHHEGELVSHFVDETNRWRKDVRQFLDDAHSSKQAMTFAVFMTTAIVCSVIVFCLSTVPKFESRQQEEIFNYFEIFFNSIFTMELLVRFYVADSFRHVLEDVYLYFDFAAVVPFWLETISRGSFESELFTLVKALRMLRLLKLARQYQETIILVKAIRNSTYALGVPFFFLGVAVVLFATLLFYLEQLELTSFMDECDQDVVCGDGWDANSALKRKCENLCLDMQDEKMVFESIPMAVWFMIVTMTTVGYGDVSPRSTIGKFIASMAAIFGVLFLAMPLAIVGNNFTTIWGDKEKVIFLEKMKESVFQDGITPERVESIFHEMDSDNSGALSFVEFTNFLKRMNIKLALNEVRKLWASIDEDRSGMISCEEFIALIFNDDEANVQDDAIDEDQKESAMEKAKRTVREKELDRLQHVVRKQSEIFTFEEGGEAVLAKTKASSSRALLGLVEGDSGGSAEQNAVEDAWGDSISSHPSAHDTRQHATAAAAALAAAEASAKVMKSQMVILETMRELQHNMKVVAKRLERIESQQLSRF